MTAPNSDLVLREPPAGQIPPELTQVSSGEPASEPAAAPEPAPLDSPATIVVEEPMAVITQSAVAAIRDLTFRLAAPDASIGAQIRGLLP